MPHGWGDATGPRELTEQHVEFMRLDQPIQMHVDKVHPVRGTPVPKQASLDVLQRYPHTNASFQSGAD